MLYNYVLETEFFTVRTNDYLLFNPKPLAWCLS